MEDNMNVEKLRFRVGLHIKIVESLIKYVVCPLKVLGRVYKSSKFHFFIYADMSIAVFLSLKNFEEIAILRVWGNKAIPAVFLD